MFITVPNLSAIKLLRRAQKELGLPQIEYHLSRWDFFHAEQGQTLEVLIYRQPAHSKISTSWIQVYFAEEGFDGNIPAFLTWLIETKPTGYHVSIPSVEEHLLLHPKTRRLSTLHYYPFQLQQRLSLRIVQKNWLGDWYFVAFRRFDSSTASRSS